jgi:hypothetical protein
MPNTRANMSTTRSGQVRLSPPASKTRKRSNTDISQTARKRSRKHLIEDDEDEGTKTKGGRDGKKKKEKESKGGSKGKKARYVYFSSLPSLTFFQPFYQENERR